MPQPAQLQQVRELIVARPDLVDALYKDKSFKKAYPTGIEGDAVKRPPKGFDPDHPHIALIKHKSFTVASGASLDKTATVNKVILPLVKRQFGGMYPLITFLRRAVS
jgi:uncharacterized protein (DUF2461 family)